MQALVAAVPYTIDKAHEFGQERDAHPSQICKNRPEQWLDEESPAIAERAKTEGAE